MSRTDARNALICGAVFVAAFFLVNPFVQIPFNDDWTYSFSAREVLRTGRMTYHCGESAAFITQAYWGALLCRWFGFSFVVLRFSTLPWAAGSAVLCYLLATEAALRASLAFLATMLLGFSPMFLPLATSFMSDVPSLFCILLAIYAFVLAARLTSRRAVLAALAIAFAASLVGGLNRQIVWIVPLTAGPYVAWLRRGERSLVIFSAIAVLITLMAAFLSAKWFYAQPYTIVEWNFVHTMQAGIGHWRFSIATWLSVLLTTLLLILPAAVPAAWSSLRATWRNRLGRRGAIAAAVALLIASELMIWPSLTLEPWLGDVVSDRGVLAGIELSGLRPVSQPLAIRTTLAAIVIVVAWLLLIELADKLFQRHPLRRLSQFLQPEDNRIAVPIMCFFVAGYLAIFLYRAPRGLLFDRYALPLMPCIAIPLLLKAGSADRTAAASIKVSWLALGLWGLYGIAATQDLHALGAARRIAMDRLLSAGIPDTAIACGFECDTWTQLVHVGHINTYGINNPPGTFDPNLGITPAMRPVYRVEFAPVAATVPSEFGSVDYVSWLWPFHRRIYIDRFRNTKWLDPASKIPPPTDYEDFRDD